MDEETKAALAAMEAKIAALTTELATLRPRPELENAISLEQYAKRIHFSGESARRRLLADPISVCPF